MLYTSEDRIYSSRYHMTVCRPRNPFLLNLERPPTMVKAISNSCNTFGMNSILIRFNVANGASCIKTFVT